MEIFRPLRKWLSRRRPATIRNAKPQPRRGSAKLHLEHLETRLAPAGYNWDSVAGTLSITLAQNEDLTISETGDRTFTIDTGTFTAAGDTPAGATATTLTFAAGDNIGASISVDNAGAGAGTNNVTFDGGVIASATINVNANEANTTSAIDFATAATTFGAAGGSVSLTSNSAGITDSSGSVGVTGTTTLNAGGNNIALDNAANDFGGDVTITNANSATLVDANAIQFASVSSTSLNVTASGAITDAIGVSLAVSNNASFNGASITLGGQAGDTINFGSLTFNSAGAVAITEDGATDLTGTNTALSLNLVSAGAIADAADTDIAVTDNATFNATSILIGDNAADVQTFGTLTFASTGTVNITEDNSTDLAGTSTGTTIVLTSAGAISDAEVDAANEITGASLSLIAGGGIGASAAAGIHVNVTNLDLAKTGGGGIFVTDTGGGVTLAALTGANAIDDGSGGAAPVTAGSFVQASSPLTFAANAITSIGAGNTMTYTADDSAAAGDDMTVDAGVTVQDTTGSMLLNVGDNLLINTTSTVWAAQNLTINLDTHAPAADAGAGSTASIFGTIQADLAGPGLAVIGINGGVDDDLILIDSNGGVLGDGGTVNNVVTAAGNFFQISGGGGIDEARLDDFDDTTGDTFAITSATVGIGGNFFDNTLGLQYNALETIRIQTSNVVTADGTGGDTVTVGDLNAGTDYFLDGNAPTTSGPNGPGDRLIVNPPGSITIYEVGGNYVFEFANSGNLNVQEFENITLLPGNGVLNIVGDEGQGTNNDPDQVNEADVVEVIGTGQNAGTLRLGHGGVFIGPPALQFSGVSFLNVTTFDAADALKVTAYADNTPAGWGIQVTYNEGLPNGVDAAADLLVYDTVAANAVSENIVVQPSGPEDGELIVTNSADGSVIVVIDYVNNLDIVVNDSDGFQSDTDTLTLRGTDPSAPNTSGGEEFQINMTNAGDAANPLVQVFDTDGGLNLYRLRNFTNFNTLNIEGLGGSDNILVIAGRDDGSLQLNVDGGNPPGGGGFSEIDTVGVRGTVDADDDFRVIPGASSDSGRVEVTRSTAVAPTIVNFTNLERVNLNGLSGTGSDLVTLEGTGGNDVFTLAGTTPLNANARVNSGPDINIFNLGSTSSDFTLNGAAGDDTFAIIPVSDWGIDDVFINAGAPSASDSVSLTLAESDDTVTYTPISANQGLVSVTNVSTTDYILNDVEGLSVDARAAAADSITVNTAGTFVHTPGAEAGAGTVQVYLGPGLSNGTLPLSYRHFEAVNHVATTAIVTGAAGNDLIVVNATTGVVTVNGNPTNYTGTNALVINALGGDDAISFVSGAQFAGGVTVLGGDNGAGDSVTINDPNPIVNFSTNTITGVVGGAISLAGIEHVTVNGADGVLDAFVVTGYGLTTDVLNVTLNGGDAGNNDGDTIDINSASGNDIIDFTPLSLTTATFANASGGPTLNITGFNNTLGSLSFNSDGGADTVRVLGSSTADTVTVQPGGAGTQVQVQAAGQTWVPLDFTNVEALTVNGQDGNDTFNVTPSATTSISIDGGDPIGVLPGDTLAIVTGGAATTYTAGPQNDEGGIAVAGNQIVSFDHIETISAIDVSGSGTATINGTGADDDITVVGVAANTVDVQINDGPIVQYTGVTNLNINAGNGDDDITLDVNVAALGVTFNIDGGLPTASDTLRVTGVDGVNDTPVWTPNSSDGGTLQLAGQAPINVALIEHLIYDGESDNESLTIIATAGADTITHTPGVNNDAGNLRVNSLLAVNYEDLGAAGSLTVNAGAAGGGRDTLVAVGTGSNDTFTVATTTGAVTLNARPVINQISVEDLTLDGLNGDDTFNIPGAHPFTNIDVQGGDPSASDVLFLTGTPGAVADTVTIRLDPGNPTAQEVLGLGAVVGNIIHVNGTELIQYTGVGGDDTLIVNPGTGNNQVRVTGSNSAGPINTVGDTVTSDSLPEVRFFDLATFRADILSGVDTITFVTRFLTEATRYEALTSTTDSIVVEGSDGSSADNYLVTNPGGGDYVRVTDNNNAVVINGTGAGIGRLQINTLGGDDFVTVNVGAPGGPIAAPITYDGGLGSDTLFVLGTPPGPDPFDNVTYTPGPAVDQGRLTYVDGGVTEMLIDFRNLEPVIDLVPSAELTVNGTNADNAFTYTPHPVGRGTNTGVVAVDGFETIEFANKIALNLNGLGGNDNFTLNNPTVPGALANSLTTINVDGGDPPGSDHVLVVGAPGNDTFAYTPTGFNSGTLVQGGTIAMTYNLTDVEGLDVDGAAGTNTLTVTTPNAQIVPGDPPGSGTVNPVDAAGQPLLSLDYIHFTGTVTVTGGTAVVLGTDENDIISVSSTGIVTVTNEFGFNNSVDLSAFDLLVINAIGGDDRITIAGNAPFTNIAVLGGDNGTGADELNFNATANVTVTTAPSVNPPLPVANPTIQQVGGPIVSFNGLEHINIDANGSNTAFVGGGQDDNYTITPNVSTVDLTVNTQPGVFFQTSDVGTFSVDGGTGSDHLVVNGTQNADTIAVTGALVTVGTLETVNYTGVEDLRVNGHAGSDTFNVTPSATTSYFLDGGDPIGVQPGDHINIAGPVAINAGPENDEGSLETAGNQPVSFDHIESITINGGGVNAGVINATNGADAITIIARDASSHAGADGVQDFTVSVNDGPEILFIDTPSLIVNALGGSDEIAVQAPAPNLAVWDVDLTLNGGLPTGSDTVIWGTPGTDQARFQATGADSGTLQILNLSSVTTMSQVEHFAYDGEGGNDLFGVGGTAGNDTITHTPGAANDEGSVRVNSLLGVSYQNLGASATLQISGAAGTDELVVEGTSNNDTFAVAATSGNVSLNSRLVINRTAIETLTLNGGAGDDTFTVTAPQTYTAITLNGGEPSASDVVNLIGDGTAVTINLGSPTTVTGGGLGTVTLAGDEVLNLDALAGDIVVNGTTGPDSLNVTPTGANTATVTLAGLNLVVNTTNTGALTVDALGGNDTIAVLGSDAVDAVTVAYAATTTVATTGRKTVSVPSASTELLALQTLGGGDTIILSPSATIATHIEAGNSIANDIVSYTVAGNARVTQADVSTSGVIDQTGAGTQNVSFSGVELLNISSNAAGADLTIRGTDDNDTIAVGLVGITAAWINDGTVVRYNVASTNFDLVTVQGRFGDDSFSVTPHVGVAITVQGGDPTASDTVVVNGTTGADTINVSPTAADTTVQVNTLGLVTLQTVEHLTINGQNGPDALTYTTPSTAIGDQHFITLTPGATADQGDITTRQSNALGGAALLPVAFQGLQSTGSLTFTNVAASRQDDLIFSGRDLANGADRFTVDSAGGVQYDELSGSGGNFIRALVPVSTPGVDALILKGLGGDDVFTVAGDHPFSEELFIEGGEPGASDVLNFTAVGAAVTVDLQNGAVVQAGGNDVSATGIEILNVDAATQNLTILATTGDDNLSVTPTGTDAATIRLVGSNPAIGATPVVNASNIGDTLTVDLLVGSDNLAVFGTQGSETITVDPTTVTVDENDVLAPPARQTVTYVSTENLQIFAQAGDDFIDVFPSTATTIFVDGGDPIGTSPGDCIEVHADAVLFESGPERDEGGFITGDDEGGLNQRVSFDHIECIIIDTDCALVIGTNGDDDITIIARDDSTHSALVGQTPGVQDFTVVVNDGIEVLYVDTPDLHVDALAGDDDIVLRAPAPNDAPWDVEVSIAGGPPSAETGDQGDVFELETPFQQIVGYTPTGSDSGQIEVDQVGGGHVASISLGTFFGACPPINYDSSQGGIELFVYDGEGFQAPVDYLDDTFTIVGTDGDDTIVHTPGSGIDEGTLRVNNLLGVTYQNLGAGATLTADGGGGTDTLVYLGTSLNDRFTVAATSGAVDLTNALGNRLDLNQTGIENLTLAGQGGDDTFTINNTTPYGTITSEGGEPGGSDVLIINGDAEADETIIVTLGFAHGDGAVDNNGVDMPYSGIEHVQLVGDGASTDSLDVNDGPALLGGGDNVWTVNAGPTLGDRIQIDDRETIDFEGFTDVSLNNNFGADLFNIHPSHLTGFSGTFTVNGDASAPVDDVLALHGTAGNDSVTSTATAINVNGVAITAGTGLVRAEIYAQAGNDTITLAAFTALPTRIEGGDGVDEITGSPQADLIYGGTGIDIILAGGGDDLVYGDSGDDVLVGNAGNDVLYGGDGNDRFGDPSARDTAANDAGNDQFLGEGGSDTFFWDPGDGDDVVEGGAGDADQILFFGNDLAAGEQFFLFADTATAVTTGPSRLHLFRAQGAIDIDAADVERVSISTLGGADTVTVGRDNLGALSDLSTTQVQTVDAVFGGADGALDNLFVEGRPLDDDLLTSVAAGIVKVAGLPYDVRLLGASLAEGDRLTVRGNEGDDEIEVNAGVETTVNVTLQGDDGDDHLSTHATTPVGAILQGGAGDDTLVGGAGDDSLSGDAGEDLMIGGGGVDTYNGDTGFDTILIKTTSFNDIIDVFQPAPSAVANDGYRITSSVTTNALTTPDTDIITQDVAGLPGVAGVRPTVEAVRIEAGAGNDIIRVGHADAYGDLLATNGVPNQTLRFEVKGDAPNASDRLIVRDDGLGDLILLRQAPDQRSGRVNVAPTVTIQNGGTGLADVVYEGIERVDITPIDSVNGGTGTDGAGRLVVLHTDPFEYNDTRFDAGELARVGASPTSPIIDPAGFGTPFAVNGDEDWYEFRPRETGTFQVKVLFDRVTPLAPNTLANGRPGLPDSGDLELHIYDAFGVLITSGVHDAGPPDQASNRTAIFAATNNPSNDPAADRFERIYIRVKGVGAQPTLSINSYDFDNIPGIGTGNPGVSDADILGPQVTNVQITGSPGFNLFGPKPTAGPTPLVNSLTISFIDQPPRAPGFLYPAIDPATAVPGAFVVIGDRTGIIPIQQIILTNHPVVQGQPATATIQIVFAEPLPDDRFALIIKDSLLDPAGNPLNGESNAPEPNGAPSFPSGDAKSGANFTGRFTVDSRPEVGTWVSGRVFVDINGNTIADPEAAGDATNRDLSFLFGRVSDHIFVGNFNPTGAAPLPLFDKVGAYGKFKGAFRFLLDFNGDGIVDANIKPKLQINGVPIAGNFSAAHQGDEIGLFDGKKWYLDTNGNNNLDRGDLSFKGQLRGLPIVGDFDGDGRLDLGTYQPDNNRFQFDLGANGYGQLDRVVDFGFAGVRERPIAADMDRDGFTDIGLYVPGGMATDNNELASWFVLTSAGTSILNRPGGASFAPAPLGTDLQFAFGNNFAIPLVGNFDPPVARIIAPSPQLSLGAGFAKNVTLSANVGLAGPGSSAGLVSRYAANGSMYWAGIVNKNDTFFVEIRRRGRGGWTTLKSKEVSVGVGQLTFVTSGKTLRVYLDGALVASVRDAGLTRGGFYGVMATVGTTVSGFSAS